MLIQYSLAFHLSYGNTLEFYNTKSVSKTELLNKFFNNTDTEFRNVLNICEKDDVLNIIFNWIEGDSGFKEDNFHDYLNCFLTKAMLPRSRIPFDKKIRDDNPDLIEQYKAEQTGIIEFLEKRASQEQAELMQAIIIILNKVIIEYEKLKHNFGYLEYDDLIIETLEALNKVQDIEAFLYSINLAFNHILIVTILLALSSYERAYSSSKKMFFSMMTYIKSIVNP